MSLYSLPSPVLRVEAFGYVKRVKDTFGLPGYAPGKIAVGPKCHIDENKNLAIANRITDRASAA